MIIILRGISGAGKSTLAKELVNLYTLRFANDARVVSADYFFHQSGEYRFDVSKIGQAHQFCFRDFMNCLEQCSRFDLIIVDNTNTQQWEFSPYKLAGETFGHSVYSILVDTPIDIAADRNIHGVPKIGVEKQHQRIESPLYGMEEHTYQPEKETPYDFCDRFVEIL